MVSEGEGVLRSLGQVTHTQLLQASAVIAADNEAFSTARQLMVHTISDARRAVPLLGFFSFADRELEVALVDDLCGWLNPEAEETLGASDWLSSPRVFDLALSGEGAAKRAGELSVRVRQHLTESSAAGIERLAECQDMPSKITQALLVEGDDIDPQAAYALFMTIFWRGLTTVWASNEITERGLQMAELDILVELDRLAEFSNVSETYDGPSNADPSSEVDVSDLRRILAGSRTAQVLTCATAGLWLLMAVDGLLYFR